MNYDVLMALITIIGLATALAILFVLSKTLRSVRDLSSEKYKHIDDYFSDPMERVQKIEKDRRAHSAGNMQSYVTRNSKTATNRIKSALQEFRSGADPDQLRKARGYSGSEMGLVMAAAGLLPNEIDSQ